MKLITKEIRAKLLANFDKRIALEGVIYDEGSTQEQVDRAYVELRSFQPAVKLFNPCGSGTWYLTEMIPEDHSTVFGLADLGLGFPEMGYISLRELEEIELPYGMRIERDIHWTTDQTIEQLATGPAN